MKEVVKGFLKILKGLGGLLVAGLVIMAFFGAFDDEAEEIGNAEIFKGNDTKSAFSDASQVRVTADGEVVGESSPGEGKQGSLSKDRDVSDEDKARDYLQPGNTYQLENGNTLTITDIDIIYDFMNRSTIGYVAVEYTNNSDGVVYLNIGDISAFVDDFQEPVNTSVPIMIDNVEYRGETLEIDPGRKGRYVYFTLFPASGESADKIELSLYGGSVLFKEGGKWLYADERADEIKARFQADQESVEAQREWNERYESLPLGVMCPEEFYGAYIDGQTGSVEGFDLQGITPGKYVNTTTNSTATAVMGENETLSLKDSVFAFENLGLVQDLSGAYSIDAKANYKVSFLGRGYIYIWTPDEVDPDNLDEGFYRQTDQ